MRAVVSTCNVGWLDSSHDFPVAVPAPKLLERLWQFCLVSVCPERGLQECPLCKKLGVAERNDTRLILGSAEIRVFDRSGQSAFAAPNLVYHYIEAHQYQPPPEFMEAMESGPQPASDEYRELLRKAGLRWIMTELDGVAFRFVKRADGEVVREWIVEPKAR
jgi:hypothetical protein